MVGHGSVIVDIKGKSSYQTIIRLCLFMIIKIPINCVVFRSMTVFE